MYWLFCKAEANHFDGLFHPVGERILCYRLCRYVLRAIDVVYISVQEPYLHVE